MAKINIAEDIKPEIHVVEGDLIVLKNYKTPVRMIVYMNGKYGALNPNTGLARMYADSIDGVIASYQSDIVRVIKSDKIEISEVV